MSMCLHAGQNQGKGQKCQLVYAKNRLMCLHGHMHNRIIKHNWVKSVHVNTPIDKRCLITEADQPKNELLKLFVILTSGA